MTKTKKIKKLLIDRDLNHQDIADRLRVSRPTITLTIAGKRGNPKIQKGIARVLGVKVEKVF